MKRSIEITLGEKTFAHHPAAGGDPEADKFFKTLLKHTDIFTNDTLFAEAGSGILATLVQQDYVVHALNSSLIDHRLC